MIYDANPPYDFWVSLHRAARGGIGQSAPRLHRPPPVERVTSTPPSSEGELKGVVFGTGIAQRGGGVLSAYPGCTVLLRRTEYSSRWESEQKRESCFKTKPNRTDLQLDSQDDVYDFIIYLVC